MNQAEAVTKTYAKPPQLPRYGSLSSIIQGIKHGQAVLDVGCDEGYLAQYLTHNQVWGIDGNAQAIIKAKKLCVDAKTVDLNNLTTKLLFAKKFDVIVFADVLEHLLYPEEVLKYFKKYLKPGGKIIVSIPNIGLWRVRLNLLIGRFDYTDYGVMDRTHLHLYTFKTGSELVIAGGYEITKVMGAANLLGAVVYHAPFLRSLLGIQIIIVAKS